MSKANVFTCIGASNHSEGEREVLDYYATEPKAVKLLLEKETFNTNIWECCCGEGHISKVLEENGYNVLSTDIVNVSRTTACKLDSHGLPFPRSLQ